MKDDIHIYPLGDHGLTIIVGSCISPKVNRIVLSLAKKIEEQTSRSIIEIVPAYASIAVYFDPMLTSFEALSDSIYKVWREHELSEEQGVQEILTIPVFYGGESGPDLGHVAQQNGVTEKKVVEKHTSNDYLVYMIGFLPGFPYLGGLDETLATPRLDSPRQEVKAGSVGIADHQTGIYPLDSPGGWNLIGHTPIDLFDPSREHPFLLKAGQIIRFRAVSEEEYHAIQDEVDRGVYEVEIQQGGDVT